MLELSETPRRRSNNCRIAFVGCVQEGKECLQEILEAGGNVVAMITFADDLAKKTSGAVPFEDISEEYGIPLYKVRSTNTPESITFLKEINPDVIFVIGWTRLVSREVLDIPKYGCIGMHASLLPKYRGRAPVNWAVINNEKVSGNTMILLDEGVDTGDIFAQRSIQISLSDTCQTVYHNVARAGRAMIREIISALDNGVLPRVPQDDKEASVMPKRSPDDGLIDWNKTALELFNWVRALTHPYPGAFTFHRYKKLLVWEVRIVHYPPLGSTKEKWRNAKPGAVMSISDGIVVSAGGNELLSLHRLNYEGEDETLWYDFLKRHGLRVGHVLGSEK